MRRLIILLALFLTVGTVGCAREEWTLQKRLLALSSAAGTDRVVKVWIYADRVSLDTKDAHWSITPEGKTHRSDRAGTAGDGDDFNLRDIRAASLDEVLDAMAWARGARPTDVVVESLPESGQALYRAFEGEGREVALRMDLSSLRFDTSRRAAIDTILGQLLPKCGEELRRVTFAYTGGVRCVNDKATYEIDQASLPHRASRDGESQAAPLRPGYVTGKVVVTVREAARKATGASAAASWTMDVIVRDGKPVFGVGFQEGDGTFKSARCDGDGACAPL